LDGQFSPETPINLMVKNPWVSGEDFPNKTNPLTGEIDIVLTKD
jgi:hypothetical protein